MSESVEKSITRIRGYLESQNQNTQLFDNPEGSHFGEAEVIKNFNEELERNPKYPLPEGYYKKKEKEITFSYVPPLINVDEKWSICFSILSEIMDSIEIPISEPKSTSREVVRAHPLFNDGMKGKSAFYDLHLKP